MAKQKDRTQGPDIPVIPVDSDNLEGTVRVLKAGLIHYGPFVTDWGLKELADWVDEREDELDREAKRNPEERGGNLSPDETPEEQPPETTPEIAIGSGDIAYERVFPSSDQSEEE